LSLLKKEIEDHAFRCATEAEKEQEEFTRKENQLSIVEKEAEEFIKVLFSIFSDSFCYALLCHLEMFPA